MGKRTSGRGRGGRDGAYRFGVSGASTSSPDDECLNPTALNVRMRSVCVQVANLRKDVELSRIAHTVEGDERALAEARLLDLQHALEWLTTSAAKDTRLSVELASDPTLRQRVVDTLHVLGEADVATVRALTTQAAESTARVGEWLARWGVAAEGQDQHRADAGRLSAAEQRAVQWEAALAKYVQQSLVDLSLPAMEAASLQCSEMVLALTSLCFSLMRYLMKDEGVIWPKDSSSAELPLPEDYRGEEPVAEPSPRSLEERVAALEGTEWRRTVGAANVDIRLTRAEEVLRVCQEQLEAEVAPLACRMACVEDGLAKLQEGLRQARASQRRVSPHSPSRQAHVLSQKLQRARESSREPSRERAVVIAEAVYTGRQLDALSDTELTKACYDGMHPVQERVRCAQQVAHRMSQLRAASRERQISPDSDPDAPWPPAR